ncbi:MAG: hypothetical protein ABW198_09245, partial [Pseudorhodoplanes sp.]
MTLIPENARRARELYVEGKLTREILSATGLNLWALYYWLGGGPKTAGVPALPPIETRKSVARRRIPERGRIVERMMRAAERQIAEIERRLEGTRQEP